MTDNVVRLFPQPQITVWSNGKWRPMGKRGAKNVLVGRYSRERARDLFEAAAEALEGMKQNHVSPSSDGTYHMHIPGCECGDRTCLQMRREGKNPLMILGKEGE